MYRLPLPFSTARLLLRRWTEDDREAIERLYTHKDIQEYIGSPWRAQPDEDWHDTFARIRDAGNDGVALCERNTGEVVGLAALVAYPNYRQESREYELSIGVACESRRRGLALEASQAIVCLALNSGQVDAVVGRVARSNQASLALVNRLGMTESEPVSNPFDGRTDRLFVSHLSQQVNSARLSAADEYQDRVLREELRLRRQEYLRERELMVEGEHSAIRSFDKAMLTLSAAALGFSISLVRFLGNGSPDWTLLQRAWLLFALAVACTVGSLYASHHAFRAEKGRVDRDFVARRRELLLAYGRQPPETDSGHERWGERNVATQVTKWTTLAAAVFFLGGMLLLIVFGGSILTTEESRMPEESIRSSNVGQAERSAPTPEHATNSDTGIERRGAAPPESSVEPVIITPPGTEPSGGTPNEPSGGSSSGEQGQR